MSRFLSRLLLLGATTAALVGPASARAQFREPAELRPNAPNTRGIAFGELAIYGNGDITSVSPLVGLSYSVLPQLELGVRYGFFWTEVEFPGGANDTLSTGNPFFFAMGRIELSRTTMLRVGGGLAAPALQITGISDDSLLSSIGSSLAAASRGFGNIWLFLPGRMSLVAPVRFDAAFGDAGFLAAEGALAILFDVGETELDGTEVAIQLAFEGGGRIGGIVEVGGRLLLTSLPTIDRDTTQLSLEPFLRVTPDPAFFELRLLMNLDEPAGFSFDDDRIWGLHIGGGGRF